jgi:predicted secreted hydrolase
MGFVVSWKSRETRLLCPAGLVLACLACAGCGSAKPSEAKQVASLHFPQDELAHDVPLEWWYYTGHLQAQSGDAWGFQFTVFKRRTGADLYLGNFAITDHQQKSFFFTEKVWFDAAATDRYALDLAGWHASGVDGHDMLSVDAGKNGLALQLTSLKPIAMHGDNGTIGSGADETHYYSRTRLDATGTLRRDGKTQEVTGQAWMDHQWFDNAVELSHLKWDWFSIQLDGSVEIMLGILRVQGEEAAEGSWVSPSGKVTALAGDQFAVHALGQWTNPKSGHTYPSGWTVDLPGQDVQLTVQPVMLDQELYGQQYTPLDYWEGEVEVSGTRAGKPVQGHGYVELTGYSD